MTEELSIISQKEELPIPRTDEYEQLVEECKGIITEGLHIAKDTVIRTWHLVGKTLREYTSQPITKLVKQVASDMGMSERNFWWAVQFYDKCPDLKMFPGGKDKTWRWVVTQYLPNKTEAELTHYVNVKIDRDKKELFISRKYEEYKILFV